MATAIRLDGLSRRPGLARFAGMSLDWWLIRADPSGAAQASDRTVARATSRLVASGDDPSGTWVARIEGPRGAMQYAMAVVPGAVQTLTASARAGHRVLVGVDDLQARSLLDAAETVSVSVVLLRTAVQEAQELGDMLTGDAVVPASMPCSAAVIKPAGTGWSVVGTRPGTLPLPVPGLHIFEHGMEPVPVEADSGGDRLRSRFGIRSLALGGAAVIVVVGAMTGIWRLEHAPAAVLTTRPGPGGGSGGACSVWSTEAAGVPSTSGGAAVAQDGSEPGSPVVLFGGIGNESKTWLWSALGQRWALAQPSASPPGRSDAALEYDPITHDLLLYGGVLANGRAANDTWAWNGCTWKRERQQAGGPPGGRTAGMVWDNALNRMVLLTYDLAAGPEATETWTWNGSGWSLGASPSASPGARGLVVAEDPVTEWPIAVSLNGTQSEPDAPSTTWTWDGTAWQKVATVHSPQAAAPAAMAIDPQTNQLVLTSPSRQPGSSTNQTWTWDGEDWSLLNDQGAPIPGAAVDDNVDGILEAFGWAADPTAPRPLHVWAWTFPSWVRLADGADGAMLNGPDTPPAGPASTAYDAAEHQLVLFGGSDGSGRPVLDTWTLAGGTWTRHTTPAHPPSAGPMVYDPFNGTVIMIAVAENGRSQTWVWNSSTWRLLRPRSEINPRGAVGDLVADPADRTVVALVSCCGSGPPKSSQTWTWNGSTWSLRDPRTGPAAIELVAAFDPVSNQVLAVGNDGTIGPALTWAWDGSTWTQLNPKSGATFDPLTSEMATDPQDQTVVLVNTSVGGAGTDVWSGSIWTNTEALVPIGASTFSSTSALYYDDTIGDVVLVGGAGDYFNEEWTWTSRTWLQLDPTPLSGTAG